jgi:myo-inositol-1(or 4)-monophosphatase
MHPMLNIAVKAARRAGQIINRASLDLDLVQVSKKQHNDFVTEVDKASEAAIIDTLKTAYPDHAILAEESGESDNESEFQWIIDPLDGTTNFAHQYPFFCVSIGFEQDGKILCGAVYDPWRDEMFSGGRGMGAFVNNEPLRVSDAQTLRSALIMTGFPYGFREKIRTIMSQFEAFMMESQGVRRGGSAALDLCYTALGRVDGFWEMDLHPWDTAAGLVILEEAGGRVTDFAGNPFSIYGKQILASNGSIHEEMRKVLGGVKS